MKQLVAAALVMWLIISPRVEAGPLNSGPVILTTDSSGFLTQIFFDESQLTEADEIAAGSGFQQFSAFFISRPIREIDGFTVFLLEPGSTVEHPVISDSIEIRHTFAHPGGGTEVSMNFVSDTSEISLTPGNFACTLFPCIVETGGIQDITALFPIASAFTALVRSDVPEPSTLMLVALGLTFLKRLRWKRGTYKYLLSVALARSSRCRAH